MVYSDIDHIDYDDTTGDFYISRTSGTVNLYNIHNEPELWVKLYDFYEEGKIEINILQKETDEERFQREFRQEYKETYGEEFEEWNW